MAKSSEQESTQPTEFDLLEKAITSYTDERKPADQVDDIDSELTRLKSIRNNLSKRVLLPDTGFSSAQWVEAMRLYTTHFLNQDEAPTKMLNYFVSQLDRTITEESAEDNANKVTRSNSKKGVNIQALETPLGFSVCGLFFGSVMLGFTYLYQGDQVDSKYPAYSDRAIREYVTSFGPSVPIDMRAYLDEEVQNREAKRRGLIIDGMWHNPLSNIGGAAALLGGIGTLAIGGIKTAVSFFTPEPEDIPTRRRKRKTS